MKYDVQQQCIRHGNGRSIYDVQIAVYTEGPDPARVLQGLVVVNSDPSPNGMFCTSSWGDFYVESPRDIAHEFLRCVRNEEKLAPLPTFVTYL